MNETIVNNNIIVHVEEPKMDDIQWIEYYGGEVCINPDAVFDDLETGRLISRDEAAIRLRYGIGGMRIRLATWCDARALVK